MANLGKVSISHSVSKEERPHGTILFGRHFNDEALHAMFASVVGDEMVEKEPRPKVTMDFALLNTTATGSMCKDFAKHFVVSRLDLSGSNDIRLEYVIEFAKVATSCTEIILPRALAGAVDALRLQFPHMTIAVES